VIEFPGNSQGDSISKRRVLGVVSDVAPGNDSGQAKVLDRLVAEMGDRVTFLTSENGGADPLTFEGYADPQSGLADGAFRVNYLGGWALKLLTYADRLEHEARARGVSCIMACTGHPLSIPAAFIAAERLSLPFVVYAFDDPVFQWEDEQIIRPLALLAERLWAPRANCLIAPNELLLHDIRARNETNVVINCAVVRNPAPPGDAYNPPWPATAGGPIRIVYTGSIYHAQADSFLNLLSALDKLQGGFELHIYTAQSSDQLKICGVHGKYVHHHNLVPATEALATQQRADILFLPLSFNRLKETIRSSSPMKASEYLQSGRPILVHAPPDCWISQFFGEQGCGAIVDRDDPSAIVASLLRFREDVEWRESLVGVARIVGRDFTDAVNKDRFWTIIDQATARRMDLPKLEFKRLEDLPPAPKVASPRLNANRPPRPPRILFVAMQGSPHTARWIEMIADRNWDLRLFPLDGGDVNPAMCGVTLYEPRLSASKPEHFRELPLPPFAQGRAQPVMIEPFRTTLGDIGGLEGLKSGRVSLGEAGETTASLYGPGVLARLIRQIQPDLIHSMEFQHAGYLVSQAKSLFNGDFPAWLATNWGSDIYHFAQFDAHRIQIERLLSQIDYYSCECHRDIKLARKYGFRGPVLRVLPNTGGFDLTHIAKLQSPKPPSQRKRVIVKGYQHFAGRAMTSLAVLESLAGNLKDYEIVLYSVSSEPLRLAQDLIERGVLNIKIIGWATHDEMLSFFASARLYLGVSVSDAISTSVLEAMAMGTFPIQTNTSCCDEWFEDGVSGYIVSPDDFDQIRQAVLSALEDDALVDSAAITNWRTVEARLNREVLAPQLAEFYQPVFDHLRINSHQTLLV
jgi:glycosyltransferase involved in cell wall biosynthesis